MILTAYLWLRGVAHIDDASPLVHGCGSGLWWPDTARPALLNLRHMHSIQISEARLRESAFLSCNIHSGGSGLWWAGAPRPAVLSLRRMHSIQISE